jgi:hypothetical protein
MPITREQAIAELRAHSKGATKCAKINNHDPAFAPLYTCIADRDRALALALEQGEGPLSPEMHAALAACGLGGER